MQVIHTILRCFKYFRNKRAWVVLYSVLTLLGIFLSVLVTYLLSKIVSLLGHGTAIGFSSYVLILGATYALTLLSSSAQFFIRERLEQDVQWEIKSHLLKEIVTRHPSNLHGMDSAKTTAILFGDTGNVPSLVFFSVGLLSTLFDIVISTVIIFSIHPLIAAILTLLLVLWSFFSAEYSKKLQRLHLRLRQETDTHFKLSRDIVKNAKFIFAASASAFHHERFQRNLDQVRHTSIQAHVNTWGLELCNSVFEYCWIIFYLLWGGARLLSGQIDAAVLTFFLLYSRRYSEGILNVLKSYASLQKSVVSVERVFELEKKLSKSSTIVPLLQLPEQVDKLEAQNISYTYSGTDEPVLSNFSQTLTPSLTLLVGNNGSGKTTFLNLLAGLLVPTKGSILLNDNPVERFSYEKLTGIIAYFMQDTPLFDMSIRDNLLAFDGGSKVSEDTIQSICRQVGILDDIQALPDAFDTKISELRDFSLGQKKKLLLVRVFLQPSHMVLLDEPLSGIDEDSKKKIVFYIEQLARSKIVVVSTHMPEHFTAPQKIIFF